MAWDEPCEKCTVNLRDALSCQGGDPSLTQCQDQGFYSRLHCPDLARLHVSELQETQTTKIVDHHRCVRSLVIKLFLIPFGERRTAIIQTRPFSLSIGIAIFQSLFPCFILLFFTGSSAILPFLSYDFSEFWVQTLFDNDQENVSLQPFGKFRFAGRRSRPSPSCFTIMGKPALTLFIIPRLRH